MTDRKAHWQKIHRERKPDEVSWHRETPAMSLAMIQRAKLRKDGRLIDVDVVKRSLRVGGNPILAAFAPDGPEECSGLPVRRYDAALVREEFGDQFQIVEEAAEFHQNPWKTLQMFNFFLLKRTP